MSCFVPPRSDNQVPDLHKSIFVFYFTCHASLVVSCIYLSCPVFVEVSPLSFQITSFPALRWFSPHKYWSICPHSCCFHLCPITWKQIICVSLLVSLVFLVSYQRPVCWIQGYLLRLLLKASLLPRSFLLSLCFSPVFLWFCFVTFSSLNSILLWFFSVSLALSFSSAEEALLVETFESCTLVPGLFFVRTST